MGIEKETLVVLKREISSDESIILWSISDLGIVEETSENGQLLIRTNEGVVTRDETKVVPLCLKCGGFKSPADVVNSSVYLAMTIANIVHMMGDLQSKFETLQSSIGSLLEGLGKTQEHLRQHESRPH